MRNRNDIASKHFGVSFDALGPRARKVTQHIADRKTITRNVALDYSADEATLGQRTADAVARFGGSWAFIGIFGAVMVAWITSNAVLVAMHGSSFDPYPFILLNLFLSMLAAIQAPIILMSQNRQSQKDRLTAEHDYEVNLKAEIEIMMLHEKLDQLRDHQLAELIKLQQSQLDELKRLVAGPAAG